MLENIKHKMKQFMIYILYALLICLVAILGVLLFNSRGKPIPFLDEKGNVLAGR